MSRENNNPVDFIQHHKLLGYVKKHPDPVKYRDAILTEFYNSGILEDKISGMMYRNDIKQTTQLAEDFKHETYYWLCKKSPEEIITLYEDNPKRLVGLAVTIAKFKCFTKSSRIAEYPKHSLMMNMLFASNLRSFNSLSETWDWVEKGIVLNAVSDEHYQIWDILNDNLSVNEQDFLDMLSKKKQKKLSRVNQTKYDSLLNSIKRIMIKHELLSKNEIEPMLNKEQIVEKVLQVLPAIQIYNITKSTNHYTDEQILTCIEIWEKGIVFTNVVRGCNGCLKHVSDVIFSYAEREKIDVAPILIPIDEVDDVVSTTPTAAPKKRVSKKK